MNIHFKLGRIYIVICEQESAAGRARHTAANRTVRPSWQQNEGGNYLLIIVSRFYDTYSNMLFLLKKGCMDNFKDVKQ